MRFDPAKSFPHPVLRPGSSDYEEVEFQVDLNLDQTAGSTELVLDASFLMSDPDLLALVETERAEYAVLVECPQTHVRIDMRNCAKDMRKTFRDGVLAGQVDLLPFLIASQQISNFRGKHWNDEYAGRTFDLSAGAVLAADTPRRVWVDTLDEGPIGAIFCVKSDKSLEDGSWTGNMVGNRVEILVSRNDKARLDEARAAARSASDWAYIMNGIYLPALIWVLAEADKDSREQQFEEFRWHASLQARLQQIGAPALGAKNAEDRVRNAQSLLDNPFSRLLSRLSPGGDE